MAGVPGLMPGSGRKKKGAYVPPAPKGGKPDGQFGPKNPEPGPDAGKKGNDSRKAQPGPGAPTGGGGRDTPGAGKDRGGFEKDRQKDRGTGKDRPPIYTPDDDGERGGYVGRSRTVGAGRAAAFGQVIDKRTVKQKLKDASARKN